MLARGHQPDPGHTWPLARAQYLPSASFRTVGQVMSTDLFTVRHGDIVDMAASLMDWQHIRHVPVEDEDGKLVGLVSHRQLLRLVATGREGSGARVEDVMTTDPVTVEPETPTLEAIALMRTHKVGCLPVLKNERLVGIVSERDFINVAAELLEQYLQGSKREEPSGG
jgi:CBS domain-containing protein